MKSSIVLVIVSASQGMAADAGGDFSNNLFSDLAPLLALFGEQFAKQFMSQSMGWLDHVIFAMAPLGILTAIVAAIRVGGPPWLKAVIGRARENRATIEMELMSSTSHEVCELWNGQGVVRSMGRPRIGQIIYLEALKDDDETFGLYNIDNVEEHLEREPPLFQNESNTSSSSGESNVQIQNGAPDDEESQMQAVEINEGAQPQKTPPKGQRKLKADNEPAPNVSLNVHDGCSPGELYSAALFGILLQSGMLVFCGVSVYYPSFSHRFTVDGGTVKPYAYPIMALGTVLLAIGMVICSAIVEQSTQEAVYKPVGKLLENPRVRVLWLQKSHTVSDQKFDSCVLFKPDDSTQQDRIRTSVRVDPSDPSKSPQGLARIASTPTEVLTVVGVFLSLCGFILQFQGLRGMNWSASIAQLVCIMLMTIWRAWVRRGLIATPISRDVLENHEMDWLALEIARSKASGNGSFWPSHGRESSENAQNNCSASEPVKDPSWEICTEIDASWGTNALKIRRRLGRLTKWDGKTALPSVAVAKSIEILMNTLFDGKKPGSEEKEERSSEEGFTDKTCFSWSVGVLVDKEPGKIQFQVKRSAPGKDWKIDSTYIDAALSLWMFHISAQEARREEVNENKADTDWLREDLELREKVVRLLGLKHSSKALQRDIKWWVGDVPINENDDNNILPGTEASALVVGFASMDSEWQASDVPESAKSTMTSDASSRFTNSITVMSQGSLVLSLAQHIFSSFMRAIAEKIPPEKLEPKETSVERADLFRAHDPETMLSLKLENKTLTRMASQIQQTGLGSLQETYLCMIPALSQSKNLPMNARTPLHYAAFDGCVNNIKLLLEKNAEKGATDDYGRVPLHLAAVAGHKEVVEILLEGEKDQSYLLDKQGRTPLHLAAMKGKDDVLSVLLGERSKADRPSETYTNVRKGTDIKDECSIKALDLAVVFGHENAAEILFDECAYNEDEIEVSLSLAAVFARINVIPFILAKAGLDIGAKVYNRHRKIGYYQILCVAMMYDC
ncbi:hypothetical protein EDC01DRAFT_617690 [Geopyxis carbonaria]|nr:hypothetical protein EDC01DRAFT_617690 [Geopyxis carbonaria]